MATRRGVLSGGTLNPFGGGGGSFDIFNVVDIGHENYLRFVKVETAWNANKATDAEYLDALQTYANSFPENSADRLNTQQRVADTKYRLARNVLVARVNDGRGSTADLLAYDRAGLAEVAKTGNKNTETYRDRQDALFNTQSRYLSEQEDGIVQRYQDGKLTTTQLSAWYRARRADPTYTGNADLLDSLDKRIHELAGRLQDEADSKTIDNYSKGHLSAASFIAYATKAKARFAGGTTEAKDWQDRIDAARDDATETPLLYRYQMSQQYAQLSKFIQNAKAPGSRTSTSHSTRTVLGQDGHWHTVTTATTKPVKPSAGELSAWADMQIQIADAKRQMAEITHKLGGVGGFVATGSMLAYYQRQQVRYSKGSDKWFEIQGRIDNLNDRRHAEQVMASEGIRITYPRVGRAPAPRGRGGGGGGGGGGPAAHYASGGGSAAVTTGNASLDTFMRVIARQESGGRYDARNASSGAFGKYQIMPANWSSWAQKAGLSPNAPQTPDNQERVARAAFGRLAKKYGNDWSRVAAAWYGGSGMADRPSSQWGPNTARYVNAIMAGLGHPPTASGAYATAGGQVGGSAAYYAPAAPHAVGSLGAAGAPKASAARRPPVTGGGGPLHIVTGVSYTRRTGTEIVSTRGAGFPTNMDGAAFEKFYSGYVGAFKAGEESFTDYSSGHAITYFIGNDVGDRIAGVRQLDDLRAGLYLEKARAHAGTSSGISAAHQYNNAVTDRIGHEYLILDTETPPSGPRSRTPRSSAAPKQSLNPLASGLALLDKTKHAIEQNIQMAKISFDQGDITAAYTYLQEAQMLTGARPDLHGTLMGNPVTIGGFAQAALNKINKLGLSPAQALGKEAGAKVQADLDRLLNWNSDLHQSFEVKVGDETGTSLLKQLYNPSTGRGILKTDAGGHVIWSEPGARGQVVLADDVDMYVDIKGKVSIKPKPAMGVSPDGGPGIDPKSVPVLVKSGSSILKARADWAAVVVGYMIAPNGSRLPLMGKQVIVNGHAWFENPLTGRWNDAGSNVNRPNAIIIKPPASINQVTSGQAGVVYQWSGGEIRGLAGMAGQSTSQATYSLIWDSTSGTYHVHMSTTGGLFQSAVADADLGSASSDARAIAALSAAGFTRDTTGLTGDALRFSDVDQAVFGLTPDEYDAYRKSMTLPGWSSQAAPYRTPDEIKLAAIQHRASLTALNAGPEAGPIRGATLYRTPDEIKAAANAHRQSLIAANTNDRASLAPLPPLPRLPVRMPAAKPYRTAPEIKRAAVAKRASTLAGELAAAARERAAAPKPVAVPRPKAGTVRRRRAPLPPIRKPAPIIQGSRGVIKS